MTSTKYLIMIFVAMDMITAYLYKFISHYGLIDLAE